MKALVFTSFPYHIVRRKREKLRILETFAIYPIPLNILQSTSKGVK